MSMYALVHGESPAADFLLGLLNLTRTDVGRFRDAFVEDAGEVIAIYTRNGGGNREHWDDEKEAGVDCGCSGCIIDLVLPAHPLYISDVDDEFDPTYATIRFKTPPEAVKLLEGLSVGKFDPSQRWMETLEALKQGKREDVVQKLTPMLDAITKRLGEEQG